MKSSPKNKQPQAKPGKPPRFKLWILWPPSARLLAISIVTLAFAVGGFLALRSSFADTLSVSIEAEDGEVEGNAGAGDGTGASGNAAVKFGTSNPNPNPPNPADLLFSGDYDSNDFNQWENCQNVYLNGSCDGIDSNHYAARIVADPKRQGQYAARFEVRDGDVPDFGGGERSEVAHDAGGGREGDSFWYQWSTYFTPNFPSDGWGTVVSQWHDNSNNSPPLSFDTVGNGEWGLVKDGNTVLWKTSQAPNTWQDIKIHIIWSSSPSVGTIELWHNGVRQSFSGGGCSGTTCKTSTIGTGGIYFKQGIYRDQSNTATGVIYHDGFTAAKSEAGLGPL